MKIEYGAVHPEFHIASDGKIYFMEIATHGGGLWWYRILHLFPLVMILWGW